MGYKILNHRTNFADVILKDSVDKNRCLEQLMDINDSIDWTKIESVMMSHYKVGNSNEGADAYAPVVLSVCC
jgi:hypothetical protein